MQISVKADVKEVTRYLNRVQKQQVPFATALALTRTAQDVQRAETAQLETKLDRPTPFTKRAIGYILANKRTLTATVFIKDIQAKYLNLQVFGGQRTAKNAGIGLPTKNKRLNKYGNIPGRRSGLVKKKNQFIANIRGIRGVWERSAAGNVKLIIAFEKVVKYRPRFPFFTIAKRVTVSKFRKNFNDAMAKALRTAR